MIALLKQKSKVQLNHKQRKSYSALDVTKRLKVAPMQMQNVTIRQDQNQISSGDGKGGK